MREGCCLGRENGLCKIDQQACECPNVLDGVSQVDPDLKEALEILLGEELMHNGKHDQMKWEWLMARRKTLLLKNGMLPNPGVLK
jgi:hypothetical protein